MNTRCPTQVDTLRPPRPPRANCKQAAAWGRYYQRCADYYRGAADALASYPNFRRACQEESRRYQQGADEVAAGRHFNQIARVWK